MLSEHIYFLDYLNFYKVTARALFDTAWEWVFKIRKHYPPPF